MSEGGSPAPTIECSAEVAGVSWTTLPPGMVIRWTDRVVVFPEVRAEPTTPTTTRKTAMPSTSSAGPRRDACW